MSPPIRAGALLALVAAALFGVTTPVIARAGVGLGPFATAALLYTGAALSALALRGVSTPSGPPIGRRQLGRLIAIALVGAALAPALLAWGLQRSGATIGSLMLNLEAVFTAVMARTVYHEPIGRRVATALGLMVLGGVALGLDVAADASWTGLGALAIAGATLGWAFDNTLTRALAEHDPLSVVAGKAALGATVTTAAALVAAEPPPALAPAVALVVCGATGYGVSLRLYLLAQRRIGAARTGSIFAAAPFVGAAVAWLVGERVAGSWTVLAAAFFGAGVLLHATERHSHRHRHPALEHDHAHRHDDGHHDHVHDPPFVGEHSHLHRHEATEHDHEHAPDVHHDHPHQ